MTTDQFTAKLNRQIEAIVKENKPLLIAVRDIMAIQSRRIFFEGKNTYGGIIGRYESKDIYVQVKDSPKSFVPKGKPKDGKSPKDKKVSFILYGNGEQRKVTKYLKKTGFARKTGYFESWLHYKVAIGRNKKFQTVDLFFRGELHRNWANAEINQPAKAIKINQHNYVTRLSELNQKKVERYGNVFNLSTKEKSTFLTRIQQELAKALK